MKRIASIVLVLAFAGTILAAADARTGAAKKAYCKRTSSKARPYVRARGQVGSEMAGWFQFQPLWQKISREEPDLFE